MAKVKERIVIDGMVKWVTGRNRQEAQLAAAQLLYDAGKLDTHKAAPERGITFRQFVEETYKPRFIDPLKATTVATYEQFLSLNLLPYLGDLPMKSIGLDTVIDFRQWMATAGERGRRKNLNSDTIRRVTGFLFRIFKIAVAMKVVEDNPVKYELLPKAGGKAGHHTALSPDDMEKIRRGIPLLKDERQRLYMALVVGTGMRPEEVRGLRWEQVHMAKRYCSMVRTVVYDKHKQPVIYDSGKTQAAIRTVVLPEAVIVLLAPAAQNHGYVIHGRSDEEPVRYSTYRRTYQQALNHLGLKGKCTSYDFRTTYATELCEAGLTSKQVADKMGHRDTRMVEQVYARTRHEGVMTGTEVLDKLNESMLL